MSKKKYFIFSDIHGNLKALSKALEENGFELDNENHILISLGDNFDRGNENLMVLMFLKHFSDLDRLLMIRGNHDDFLLNFLLGKDNGIFNVRYNGLGRTLIEFSDEDSNTTEKIRNSINKNYPFLIPLLENMKDKIEIGNKVLTHAGYSLDIRDNTWFIDNFSDTAKFVYKYDPKDKIYIFGHFHAERLNLIFKDKKSNEIFQYRNFIGIDGNTYRNNKVHIIILDELGNIIKK